MTWVTIHAGRDHLQQFARRSPIDAISELIWNGLDAEADLVDVDIEFGSMFDGARELMYVTHVTVTDNGHGMTWETAQETFASLGDSWKRTLNGRTVNGKRALHGSLGRGRFYAYSLGQRATWSSVSKSGDGFTRVEIAGDQGRIDGFTIGEPQAADGPAGTTVIVTVEQGRTLGALMRDDVPEQIAARLAPHLLGNADIAVRVNGRKVDPRPLVEGEPIEHPLGEVPPEDLADHEVPVLLLVDWTDEMRSAPGIVLCNEHGASLVELEKSAPPGTVRSTGYLSPDPPMR